MLRSAAICKSPRIPQNRYVALYVEKKRGRKGEVFKEKGEVAYDVDTSLLGPIALRSFAQVSICLLCLARRRSTPRVCDRSGANTSHLNGVSSRSSASLSWV